MPDLRRLAAELDGVLTERVLVHGSDPVRAGDLDLLVGPSSRRALEHWLPGAGFTPVPQGWLRLQGGQAEVVDLCDRDRWGLPADAVHDLFAQAVPLHGAQHLVRPAPHHALLVLARRLADLDGGLGHRRAVRARRALDEDPAALARARVLAPAWRCAGALEVLAAELGGSPCTASQRRRLLDQDRRRRRVVRRMVRAVRHRRGRGVVVALSGLDGAGKSTLAWALFDALDSLDLEPVVLWHRISYGRTLQVLAAPAKAAQQLTRVRSRRVRDEGQAGSSGPPAGAASPVAPSGPPRSGASTAWPLLVSLVHVLTAGPVTRHHLRRGRIVLRDRYVLDALVHQRFRYGPAAPAAVHRPLLERGLPRAAVAVLLDLTAEQALDRKRDQYDLAQLRRQRELYLEHCEELGVVRLDGTSAPAQLHAQLVLAVLAALGHPGAVAQSP